MTTSFEKYAKSLQIERFFKRLGAPNSAVLAKEVEHFTTKEAEKRDKIVVNYFGEDGVNRITNTIADLLLSPPRPPKDAKVLDVGAGTGFFTVRVAEKTRAQLSGATFYAMDLTPAMLLSLSKKKADITPFVGIAENIHGSIREARKHFNVPYKFDAVFSTLMLHHSTQPEKVFKSIRTVLKKKGKAVVVDLCEHCFEEFKTEMGDVHLGFDPERICETARKHFHEVKVEKMPGIRCESSGRSAEIFYAIMQNRP
jgi:SAM-dependent methyltransferase